MIRGEGGGRSLSACAVQPGHRLQRNDRTVTPKLMSRSVTDHEGCSGAVSAGSAASAYDQKNASQLDDGRGSAGFARDPHPFCLLAWIVLLRGRIL
jgi:hypothetical protein